ncbi:GNAT family N-acetyltransferase [Photobacterium leiognathi]|uniref:GNAT family N-acetyltransferase n=1 Tax=Photobacterium leiognathi TaxID=553611 RepID=UPI003D9FB4B3
MKLDFELSTPRLTLRPFKNADLSDFLTAVHESTADLSPWLEWCDDHFNQHDAHEWINASRLSWQTDFSYEFAIFNRFDDEFLGTVSLSAIIPMTNSANLGYWIRSSYHQQGFATEANTAAVQFAFQMLGLTRLEIVTHIDNYASQKTAKACNAQFECEARNRIFYHNKPLDGLVFSLVPTDLMV